MSAPRPAPRALRSPPLVRGLPALLLGLPLLGACRGDPVQADAQAYVAQMQPIMVENMALTRQFVDVATEVKRGTIDPRAVATRFEQTLVPGATRLRDEVLAVQPKTEGLATTHRALAEAWTTRVEVYGELHRAWGATELNAFDAAMHKDLEVKAAEERYFTDVNHQLAVYGLGLDQFP